MDDMCGMVSVLRTVVCGGTSRLSPPDEEDTNANANKGSKKSRSNA